MPRQFLRFLAACTTVLMISACSTQPPAHQESSMFAGLSRPAESPAMPAAEAVADSAFLAGARFYIRYRTGNTPAYATGLRETAEARPGSNPLPPDMLTGAAPEVALQPLREAAWTAGIAAIESDLSILPASLWEAVFQQLRKTLTPRQANTGAVVDILELEEWFTWYDDTGSLQWVLIEDKPAHVHVKHSYTFRQVLEVLLAVLEDYLDTTGISDRQMLINTGATGPDSTPFVYADLDQGLALFLTRRPDQGATQAVKRNVARVRATTHVVIGQVRSLLERPMTSAGRLFARTSHDMLDTIHKTVLLPQRTEDVPPPGNAPGMDLQAWESELDEITGTTASAGRINYLVDGTEFFPRLIDVIQSARHSIDLRMYIFDDDDYAIKIADILKARSAEVKIRVLLDGLGTIGSATQESESLPQEHRAPPSIFHYLEEGSGIRVKTVSNFWLTGDHSKSIVVDNHIGFIGGMNIGREYRYHWHDMMVELEGPVVDSLREDFFNAWVHESFLGDLKLLMRRYKPAGVDTREGDYPIRVLFTRPADSQIYRAQLAAIRNARSYIYIESAYFTDDVVVHELVRARARGVDVRVILPLRSDFGLMKRNNVLLANTLLDNGIRVYIYPGMSHLKAAVYDSWLCLGSANLDKLSLRVNKEINIATSHAEPVDELLQRVFIPDMEASVELTEPFPENWLDFLVEMMADHL